MANGTKYEALWQLKLVHVQSYMFHERPLKARSRELAVQLFLVIRKNSKATLSGMSPEEGIKSTRPTFYCMKISTFGPRFVQAKFRLASLPSRSWRRPW